ncbi:MAG TPA: choice-of-anchor D domain-containing protein [Candidatus Dormibacteraeota bacterium]|nr:choice-of-anchor D domain-containing protein [Candidatus Dormibacteraeota bacterium]
MRRLLAIGAVTVVILAALALGSSSTLRRVSAAPANPGNLSLFGVTQYLGGCSIGPAYTFCDQPPGTTSQSETFYVNNSGAVTGVAVALGPIPGLTGDFAAGDFTISGNSCTGSIAANLQCEVHVKFSPTTTGLRSAALTVTDSQGDSLPINIEGTGNKLALTPPSGGLDNSVSYGGVTIDTTSAAQTFTVTAGAALTQIHLSLSAIPGLESEFASGGADFLVTSSCGALAAGGACTATVEFTPTAIGLRSAALVATDSEGDTSTVYISGYGVNGPGGTTESPALFFPFTQPGANTATCARTNYFGFCNSPVGGVSATSTFTMQNTSGTQITGLSVPTGSVIAQDATAPDFTVQSTSCASVLASGASCNITVAFTPTASGLRQGAVLVTDAQGDSTAINLAGYANDYSITTQIPAELSVIPGGTITFNATLTPDNVFGMNGEQVTFTCPTNLPTDTSCAVTPCPAMITPGTPVNVQMTIVTSSAKVIAPVPSAGCSSYGPSHSELMGIPPAERPALPVSAAAANKSSSLDLALIVFLAFGAMGLLLAAFAAPGSAASRRRMSLLIAGAGLAAAILAGCHHKGATTTDATPIGQTALTFQGPALDANGNSLNAARSFQAILDVVTK